MHKAVSLADEAVSSHQASSSASDKGKSREGASVVLALSCYGAILSPGQEYSGRYPPPYGHSSHQASSVTIPNTTVPLSNSATSLDSEEIEENNVDWTKQAENELEKWHFERLKVFASNSEIWNKISYIAFETIPVLYEGRAIRKAMTRLKNYLIEQSDSNEQKLEASKGINWPKWWISFVFPNGSLPSKTSLEAGDLSPHNIARTVFKEKKICVTRGDDGEKVVEVELEIPYGLGINCTKMRYLPKLVEEYTLSLQEISSTGNQERTLVLYPDGGLVYDPNTKTWHQDGSTISESSNQITPASKEEEGGYPAQIWASQLVKIANKALSSYSEEMKAWDSVIIGGCCKASPAYIAELAKLV